MLVIEKLIAKRRGWRMWTLYLLIGVQDPSLRAVSLL